MSNRRDAACDAPVVAPGQQLQNRVNTTGVIVTIVLGMSTLAGLLVKSGADIGSAQTRIATMEKWEQEHLAVSSTGMVQLDARLARMEEEQIAQGKASARIEGALKEIARRVK